MSHLVLSTYTEDESFLCTGELEPHCRQQQITYVCQRKRWHVRIAFSIRIQDYKHASDTPPLLKKLQRQREFQQFIRRINFSRLPLIDNTVTEVQLWDREGIAPRDKHPAVQLPILDEVGFTSGNSFMRITSKVLFTIREDPSKINFPIYSRVQNLRTVSEHDIRKEVMIVGAVSRIWLMDNRLLSSSSEFKDRSTSRPTPMSLHRSSTT